MNGREASDLEKKLNELLYHYKEEPHNSAINVAVQSLGGLDPAKESLKHFLKCESVLPTTLIQLIETQHPGSDRPARERSSDRMSRATKIPIGLLDLVYYCIINDIFSRMQVFEIISRISKVSWTTPCVMKILQMSFYFIRYDLDDNMAFRLLRLIVESFIAEDSSLDLVARPIVIQVTESLLKTMIANNEDQGYAPGMHIFDFIYDTIVVKKNYFASYILLVVIKHPQIDRLPEFVSFIKDGFFEISLTVLRNSKQEDSAPIYEAVLKTERSFHQALRPELDSFYSKLDGIESEFLLKFIACLVKVREEIPESIFILLCKITNSISLYDRESEKMIKLLEGIVSSTNKRVDLSKKLVEMIFLKTKADLKTDARTRSKLGTSDFCADSLLRACLRHCAENSLRDSFEIGLKECSIGTLADMVVELRDYMGPSWYIYFETSAEYNLEFLQSFTKDQINSFVSGLADGNSLGLKIFENGHGVLADENNTDILELLLSKVTDPQVLFDISFKFYGLNAQQRASPVPLGFLKSFFDSHLEKLAEFFSFLNEIIRMVDPKDCWNQIFGILMMGDSFYHEKIQIMLHIEQDHLNDLEEKHLRMILYLLEQMMFPSSAGHVSNEVVLNAIFIYKEFGEFALTQRKYNIWKDIMSFGVRMVQIQEHSISEVFLKHLFGLFTIGLDQMLDEDLLFMNEAVMIKLYAVRDTPKLISILNEIQQFITGRSLGIYTVDLISFLSATICGMDLESAREQPICSEPSPSKDMLPTLALECLTAICKKYKTDFEGSGLTGKPVPTYRRPKDKTKCKSTESQIYKANSVGEKNGQCPAAVSVDADTSKLGESIHFYEIADTGSGSTDSNKISDKDLNELQTIDTDLINSRVFPPAHAASLPGKDAHRVVVSTLITAFTYILSNCGLEQYSIISSILQIIPSFYFSSSEINELSEHLRKFVALSDPYRTEAIDCFVKTCGNSNGCSYCLKVLSSWLSKDSKETSLTLIDKISNKISENLEHDLVGGLVNFIDYSVQFSGSDEFLEPVLNVISKSGPKIDDVETFDKLYAFSFKFITEQLSIPYTSKREGVILHYLHFFDELLQKFPNEVYLGLPIAILHSNRHYLNLRLRSYEILFESYSFSERLLKSELKARIYSYSRQFLREGFGISNLLTIELTFCLNQICNSKNAELIDNLKDELVDLLVVNDFEVVNSVRKSMKILFTSK